jgi:hypothetical protein
VTDAPRPPIASLAERFARFACEARTYAGPLYEALSTQIAADPDLLAVARHVRRPPVPNEFFAAVHFLLAAAPAHELSAFYGSLRDNPASPAGAYPAFRRFVLANTAELIPLLQTRITQTNEVRRCSYLLPAFADVHRRAGGTPLALIDVGCSAGLHLRWDRYHYDYGVRQVGDPRAPVKIACELRGPMMPPLPDVFPECRFRIGIDLNPVDVSNPIERRWLDALIWPDHSARRRLAAAAIDALVSDPVTIVKGNAIEMLEPQLAEVPFDAALLVYNSAALCQGGAVEEDAIAAVLKTGSTRRTIYWVHCENEGVRLRVVNRSRIVEMTLAHMDGHGRWLEWLDQKERM